MWNYEKRLQVPVNIKTTSARLAQTIISQFGGPDGELSASMRYLAQRYTMPNRNCMGLLTDIGTEESVLAFESISTYLKARISPSLFTLKRIIHYLFKMDFAINPTRFPYVTYSHLLPFSSSS